VNDDSIDFEYIKKVCDGDAESFRFFIVKYKDVLFTYASTILADRHLAEEAVQDAFLNAFRYLKAFRKKSSFKTWLIKIVINEANKKRKQINPKVILSEHFNENLIWTNESPEINDNVQLIRYALNKLDSDKSLALRLFYLDEYSIKEISQLTNWGTSKTKVTLHRAKKEILQLVKELQTKKSK
jgi:RNA polymerase sigma-70 factor (ECF subfamily)